MINNANYYLSANPGWAISDPSWGVNTPGVNTLFNYAITYMKGSCVLHQLRYVLGDSLYFAGLRSYSADTNFKYKSATIPDFRDKMESVSGQDLNWFFDEWIYKANHPKYRNVYAFKHLESGKWQVQFTARQSNLALDPYWQMPLEIKINFKNLSDTLIRVFNSYNDQIFTFEFDHEPANLVFDPNQDIILKSGYTIVGTDELIAASAVGLKVTPSPFSSSASISYQLEQPSEVIIQMFDQFGRTIKIFETGRQTAGDHLFRLDGTSIPAGIYFLRLVAGEKVETVKVIHE